MKRQSNHHKQSDMERRQVASQELLEALKMPALIPDNYRNYRIVAERLPEARRECQKWFAEMAAKN